LQDVLSRSERAFAGSKNAEQKESEGGKWLKLGKFHPSIPASGEDYTLQINILGINLNISSFVK